MHRFPYSPYLVSSRNAIYSPLERERALIDETK